MEKALRCLGGADPQDGSDDEEIGGMSTVWVMTSEARRKYSTFW